MTGPRYWVVSPNVDHYEKTVKDWKRLIVENRWAIMGYGPCEYTGKKGRGKIGPQFAGLDEPPVQQGDVMLVARSRENKDVVAAGIVASKSILKKYPELRRSGKPVQIRQLTNFKDLRKARRTRVNQALKKSLPHRGAMRELQDSDEDVKVKKWLNQLLEIGSQIEVETGGRRGPLQRDLETRYKVEQAAYEAVRRFYDEQEQCEEVRDVHKEKRGYDLEAIKSGRILKIEVKGLEGPKAVAELTPKEYEFVEKGDLNFRLCIVTNALKRRPKKHIHEFKFNPKKKAWFDRGKKLKVEPRLGAVVRVED